MSWVKNNEWLNGDRQSVDWTELRVFGRELTDCRQALAVALGLSIVSSLLVLWAPGLIRQIQTSLQSHSISPALAALAKFAALLLAQTAFNSTSRVLRSTASFALNKKLLIAYYEKLLRSDIEEYYAFTKRTNLFQRVIDATGITGSFIESILAGIQQSVSALVLLIVLARISVLATAIILGGSLLLAVGAYYSASVSRKLRSDVMTLNYPLVSKLLEVLHALSMIKVLSGTLRVTRDVTSLAERKEQAEVRETRHEMLWTVISSAGSTVLQIGAVAAAIVELSRGALQPADVFSVYVLSSWVLPPLSDLAKLYHQLASVSVNIRGYHEVMRMQQERCRTALQTAVRREALVSIAVGAASITRRTAQATAVLEMDAEPVIEFCNVFFGYRDGPPVIQDMSFVIRRGERVSIIGRSGSGKTTVLRIMLGLVTPQAGEVLIHGEALRDCDDIQAHRNRFGVVTQSDILFEMTLRDNLLFGCQDAVPDSTVWITLDEVGLREDVAALAGKLDAIVTDSMFSGGQRQRLSVARALLRRPEFALLDEPTSSLDFENEERVLRSMDAFTTNRTTITVAHRLSTVRAASRILVVEDGRIRSTGTHAELMEQDEYYRSLCKFNSFIL